MVKSVMKRKIVTFILILMLVFTWLSTINIRNSYSQTFTDGSESINMFTNSKSIYVKASLIGSEYLFNQFNKNIMSTHPSGVKKVSISFIRLFDWKNSYTYFFDELWYNNTDIKYIPPTYVDMKLYSVENHSIYNVSSYLHTLEKYYYLYFFKVNKSSGYLEYISPYQHEVSFNKVISILGKNYPAVFRWINLDKLDAYDFYNITLSIDYSSSKASFQVSYINFQQQGISSLLRLFSWYPVKNDTRNIYVNFYSKFAEITSYPPIYNLTVIDPNTLFIHLNAVLKGNSSKNPFDINVQYELPHLYVERTLNDTQPKEGDFIKVTVKITNTGASEVKNVHVSEPHWWDGNKILFENGVINRTYSTIPPSTSKIIEYIVKINTSKNLNIKIPSSNVTVEVYNNSFLMYRSNENFLHLNSKSPFLNVFIEEESKSVVPGEDYDYALGVTNEGNASAYNLQLGEFLIESLSPGETRKVELKTSVDNAFNLIKQISSKITYSFSNKTFELASPSYPILFKPDKIIAPSAYLYVGYNIINDTYIDTVFKISNIGIEDIPKMDLKGIILSEFKYVSGNFTYNSRNNVFYINNIVLGRGSNVEYHAIFRVNTSDILLYPLVKISSTDGKLTIVRYGSVDVFYNKSISLAEDIPKSPLLVGEKYNYTITLANNGEADIYNLTTTLGKLSSSINISSFNKVSYIASNSSSQLIFLFYGLESGNISLPGVKLNFILAGKKREISVSPVSLVFAYGMKIFISPRESSMTEGKSINLKLVFQTDSPEYVHDINISIKFPKGLVLGNKERTFTKSIKTILSKYTLELDIHGVTPGKYNVSDITVTYYFKDKKIDLATQYPSSLSIVINVKENIIKRYFTYFIIGLIISIGVGVYLRKTLR